MIGLAALVAPVISFSLSGRLELPVKLLLGLSLVESALIAWFLFLVLGRHRNRSAVQLVEESPDELVLFCGNESWGQELARLSDGKLEKSRERLPLGLLFCTAAAAASLAFPAAYFGWIEAHGVVKIDNATTQSLEIWVDGKRAIEVPPNPDGSPPPELWLRVGRHRFSQGSAGAADDTTAIDVDVARTQHLYTPGAKACYWQVQSFYSNDINKRREPMESVLPRVAFQELRRVDDWFVESPSQLDVREGETNASRVAILRNPGCTALARHDCAADVIDRYIACENRAQSRAALEMCISRALASCGLERTEGKTP